MVKIDGVTFPDGQGMKQIDEDGYRYLGILELNRVKEGELEMRIHCQKEYKRKLKMELKSKLNSN